MVSCSYRFGIFSVILIIFFVSFANALLTGAPDRSCKDPSTFHTRKFNATHKGIILPKNMSNNPYFLDVNSLSFRPGSSVTVTVHGGPSQTPFKGFFIQAVQAGVGLTNFRRQAFGTFQNISLDARPSTCEPLNNIPRGGITHTNNNTKLSVSVEWVAPMDYNPGEIQFLATVVLQYDTYWTDVRSSVLVPEGYTASDTGSGNLNDQWTATAAWYQWLHHLQGHGVA